MASFSDEFGGGGLFIGAIALGLAAFIGLCVLFFGFTADDAYLVARYARNMAEQGVPGFNPGEPVNALVSPLQAAVQTGIHAVAGTSVLTYKVAAVAFVAFAIAVLIQLVSWEPQRALYVAIALGTSPHIAFWTVAGLETPLVTALIALFVALAWRDRRGTQYGHYLHVLAALAFLARHDTIVFTLPILLPLTLGALAGVRMWAGLTAGLLLVAGWLYIVVSLFGDPLGTPYHLALETDLLNNVQRNALYVFSAILITATYWIIAWPFSSRRGGDYEGPPLIGFGLLCALIYQLFGAAEPGQYAYRALVPYAPAAVALLAGFHVSPIRYVNAAFIALLVNGLLLLAMLTVTVNPTVYHLYIGARAGIWNGAAWYSFEHPATPFDGLRAHAALLGRAASVIDAHWSLNAPDGGRAPRIMTSEPGWTTAITPIAYVYERRLTARQGCIRTAEDLARLWPYADYLVGYADRDRRIAWPRLTAGAVEAVATLPTILQEPQTLLPSLDLPALTEPLDLVIWHNPAPKPWPDPVPNTFRGDCATQNRPVG